MALTPDLVYPYAALMTLTNGILLLVLLRQATLLDKRRIEVDDLNLDNIELENELRTIQDENEQLLNK